MSPDGKEFLVSYQERDNCYYTQGDLWVCNESHILGQASIQVTDLRKITGSIDQSLFGSTWTESGVITNYFEHTRGTISLINPETGNEKKLGLIDNYYGTFFQSNRRGDLVCSGSHLEKLNEVFLLRCDGEVIKLSDDASLFTELPVSSIETVSWTSMDGTVIKGIMRKPLNFDNSKNYPLVFIVHGGPSWLSFESIFGSQDRLYYPALQFASEDIITIYPNYRGSIGRGQSFLELNVNNLGIGDLWDVESAIDHFKAQGYIDEHRIGCMGWSQGGYISAMATTHASDRFCATSVGAGISDWYSYWMTTDIRKFTVDYLSASPVENRKIYHKTSPMSALDKANTPTLIQIGEKDQRVPLVNATELYRSLLDKKVPTELFVFEGMPHGINKPRENLAVISQNYQWFMHYLKDIPFDTFDDSFFTSNTE